MLLWSLNLSMSPIAIQLPAKNPMFLSKRVILVDSLLNEQEMLQCFQWLLKDYPEWNRHVLLGFLSNHSKQGKNVYYFEKNSFDALVPIAAVQIIKSNQCLELIDGNHNKTKLADIMNYHDIARLLNIALVSILF